MKPVNLKTSHRSQVYRLFFFFLCPYSFFKRRAHEWLSRSMNVFLPSFHRIRALNTCSAYQKDMIGMDIFLQRGKRVKGVLADCAIEPDRKSDDFGQHSFHFIKNGIGFANSIGVSWVLQQMENMPALVFQCILVELIHGH